MRRTTAVTILFALLGLALFSGTALAAKLTKYETPHFVFYYEPRGITANIGERAAEIERYYERLTALLGGKPGRKIVVKWYPTREEFQKAEASTYAGFIDHYQKEVQSGGEPSMVIYGVTFILADAVGQPSRFILDGLAIAFFQENGGTSWLWEEPLLNYVKDHEGQWIQLSRLSGNMDYFSKDLIARAEAGLFIRYLAETYGVDRFRKFLTRLQPESNLSAKAKTVYGKSLEELEAEIRAWLGREPRITADPALASLPETPVAVFSHQKYILDEANFVPERVTEAATRFAETLSVLKADLDLQAPGKIDWRIMDPDTLKSLGRDKGGEVDAAGVVRAPRLYDPSLLTLAVTRLAGPAPEALRWGVAVVWGRPQGEDPSWDGRTLQRWGKTIAENELLIPLDRLARDFPCGAPDRAKAEAGLLVQYLVDRYGKEKFTAFYRAATNAEAFGPALEALAGKPVAEVEREFLASLAQ